jgi:hypothetical protein
MNESFVQVNPTLVGPDYPGDNLHQRAFAGPIFAYHGVDRAERACKINVRECRDSAIPFGDPF